MLPVIVSALLTKGLDLLGNAVLAKGKDWVEKETGVDLSKPEMSPSDYLALQKYTMDHQEELIKLRQDDDKLEFEREKLYIQDVQDARSMQEAALGQSDVFSKRFIYYFATAWSSFAAIYILAITFMIIPEGNVRFADTILGFLLGSVVAVILQFFFGSSRNSQTKDATINELSKVAK